MKRRTNLFLDDETRERLQAMAALRRCSQSAIVDELVEIAAETLAEPEETGICYWCRRKLPRSKLRMFDSDNDCCSDMSQCPGDPLRREGSDR